MLTPSLVVRAAVEGWSGGGEVLDKGIQGVVHRRAHLPPARVRAWPQRGRVVFSCHSFSRMEEVSAEAVGAAGLVTRFFFCFTVPGSGGLVAPSPHHPLPTPTTLKVRQCLTSPRSPEHGVGAGGRGAGTSPGRGGIPWRFRVFLCKKHKIPPAPFPSRSVRLPPRQCMACTLCDV